MLSHDRVCGGGQREAELHGGDQTGGETWWLGRIEEVPGVNCQERTREELLETLRITLAGALELNRREGAPGGWRRVRGDLDRRMKRQELLRLFRKRS
jgi:hypothetical protein